MKIVQNNLSKEQRIDNEQKPTINFTFTYIWKTCVNNLFLKQIEKWLNYSAQTNFFKLSDWFVTKLNFVWLKTNRNFFKKIGLFLLLNQTESNYINK